MDKVFDQWNTVHKYDYFRDLLSFISLYIITYNWSCKGFIENQFYLFFTFLCIVFPRLCRILLIWKSNHKDIMKFLGAKNWYFCRHLRRLCKKDNGVFVIWNDIFFNYLIPEYLLEELSFKNVGFEWFNLKNGVNKRFIEDVHTQT